MFLFKNKLICLIVTVFIISLFIPFFSLAKDKTSFVWSDISSPTLETATTLTEGKRKFPKLNLWWSNTY